MATPAFRAVVSSLITGATPTSWSGAQPAATVVGDFMLVALITARAATAGPAWTPPAGWTVVASNGGGTTTATRIAIDVFSKIATTGGAAAIPAFTSTTNQPGMAVVAAYSDAGTVDVTGTSSVPASNTTGRIPGITTTKPNELWVGLLAHTATAATYTPATGFTERLDTNGNNAYFELSDIVVATASAQADANATLSAASTDKIGISVVLGPPTLRDSVGILIG